MRIDAINQVSQLYQKNGTRKAAGAAYTQASDSLEISQIGKDIQVAKQAVNHASDVREDRIAELKAAFENGTYSVSDEDLADKLLNDYFDLPF